MSVCTIVVGVIVFVALASVSIPALAIVAVGGLALWLLSGSRRSGVDEACKLKRPATPPDDDARSDDSGILSAREFAMGAVKGELARPHTQPPAPPTGEVSAFRTIKASDGVARDDALYENHLDADHYGQRMSRGHEGSLKHFYETGLNRAMQVARKELPMKDPNLIPLDPSEPSGCPRPLGKI